MTELIDDTDTSPRTIGLIGAGNIGSTVAALAIRAGYDVVLANSRGPETLVDLVGRLGDRARAASAQDAAEAGDLVVATIPLHAYRELPAEPLAGKTVIDTINYYPQRDGHFEDLDQESTTTSELVQEHLSESHVVKAFNNIYFEHLGLLARPRGAEGRSALAIAGDDAGAKQEVTAFLDAIGYDAYDLGPLAEGWRTQRDTAAYGVMYAADPENFQQSDPRPAGREEVAARAAESRRYRDM